MKKFSIFTLAMFSTLCAFAQSVTTLGFTPQTVRPNEMASYIISLKDASPKINISDIPVPDGLQYVGSGRSERFTMSTGKGAERETQITFNFIPIKAGEYEIKAWQLKDGAKVYDIASAKLKVDANAPQNIKPSSRTMRAPFEEFENFFGTSARRNSARSEPAQTIDLNKEITISVEIPKEKIYVGEAVKCKVAVKFNRKIFDAALTLNGLEPRIKDSDAFFCAGFKKEPYEKSAPDSSSTTVYFDTAITPLKAGKLNLQFEANGILTSAPSMGSGFFSLGGFGNQHQFAINMQPLELDVAELPLDVPQDFSGAIGEFKIESASVDEASLTVGEPCLLTVKISGNGNFERMSAPILEEKSGWKEYKPKSSFVDTNAGYSISGTKTFEYTLIAQKPDMPTAPIASLTYFDPNLGQFKTIKSNPISVSVAPSKSYAKRAKSIDQKEDAAQKSPSALSEIKDEKSSNISAVSSAWFWLAQAIVLALVIIFIIVKRNKLRLQNDPEYARIVRAKADLNSALANAKSAAQGGKAKEFFESASCALQNAIALVSGLQAQAVTLGDAQETLSKLQMKADYLNDIKTFFDGANAIAYGGQAPQASELNQMYQKLEALCSQISQK